ncbi:unnamed protein product [Thelazia callipaeda]|uniref:Uncharacterized protein n=1 Tax=Thelazia callipaeda TaxID=103827 RepID=A0A0N5DCF8_THECL|nr:unnamed protein product [Thelazia callipaeda]
MTHFITWNEFFQILVLLDITILSHFDVPHRSLKIPDFLSLYIVAVLRSDFYENMKPSSQLESGILYFECTSVAVFFIIRLQMNNIIEARKRLRQKQKDLVVRNMNDDVKFFEQEEERIRIDELRNDVEEHHRPRVKVLNEQFIILIQDILKVLTSSQQQHFAELALQLDFTNFYQPL